MKNDSPILLIEDDAIDAMTVKRALRDNNITNELIVKKNGEEGLSYFQEANYQKPCLILLDINMPIMNGLEFLKERKAYDAVKRIPVVVLTTSNDDSDRFESYDLDIAGYIIKPVDYHQFMEVIKVVDLYFTISEGSE